MKLAIIEPLGISDIEAAELTAGLTLQGLEMVYYSTPPADEAELAVRAQGAEIVMLANTPLTEKVLRQLPDLKLLSVAFTGVDHIDLSYCHAHGITVCNCAGYATEAVSELTIGLAIGLYRELLASDSRVRDGVTRGLPGLELHGKTFGIIGAGAIGLRTAELARAFGCRVLAYSRTPKTLEGVAFVSFEELLRQSDIVSLHVPLTEETRNLLGKKQLAMMKRSAILINTARGPIVNSESLAAALQRGTIAGAATDVFEYEPPIEAEHALLHAPHVMLAPHIGFSTREALQKRAATAFANIQKWADGTPQNVM